jgi:hypothetical protein
VDEDVATATLLGLLRGRLSIKAFGDLVFKHGSKQCWELEGDSDYERRLVYKFEKAFRVSYAIYRGLIVRSLEAKTFITCVSIG